MKKVLILVEGQTEEHFVQVVLQEHFKSLDIHVEPTLLTTKVVINGPNFKGGVSKYAKIRRDLIPLLHDSSAAAVTTMLDLYALPVDFPGMDTLSTADSYKKVNHLENAFGDDIRIHKFIPNLILHEFETLLFSAPDLISEVIGVNGEAKKKLIDIKHNFVNPELINDHQTTCPHRRIENEINEYVKSLYGPLIVNEIGLDTIRNECKHFDDWVSKIEAI